MSMFDNAAISRPKKCEDCELSYRDSDHGMTCNYNEEVFSFDRLTDDLDKLEINCIFSDKSFI